MAATIGAIATCPRTASADGLLYQLPEDGSWVRFDSEYTFKVGEAAGRGTGTMTMASVGKTVEGKDACRWIEFDVRLKDSGNEHTLIRKLLIPEKHLKRGENGTEHVVRGWAKFDDEKVDRAVPLHGRWPAYLAGPLKDERKLANERVESKLGALECEGVTGFIEYHADDMDTKVTYEMRLHERAPFGVVSGRMLFEVTRDGKIAQTIDARLKLTDFGKDAKTALPEHR
jgi:hypothetical protein